MCASSQCKLGHEFRPVSTSSAHTLDCLVAQAHLGPLHAALRKLQYELKAVSSEVNQMSTAATLMAGASNRILQMQHKSQALQSCIDSKLQEVSQACSLLGLAHGALH